MDICTYGLQLSVHIGNAIAHLTQNERGESVLQYDIPEPTLVCMHAIEIELGNVAGRHARKPERTRRSPSTLPRTPATS